jgi:tripartite-type tricarboxylate transporter receptor subunit TctC
MASTGILAANSARLRHDRFDPELDFEPITLVGRQANVLVVHPSVPAVTLTQLIDLARAKPGLLTFASWGHGSPSHLAGELFKAKGKVDIVHVPYKKPGPALQDVVGGHVQMAFAPAAVVASQVRAGRLRAIAVATAARSPILPAVATMDEVGLPGFDATTWYGLVAPAGTPAEIIDVLHHTSATALEDPKLRRIMANLGIDVVGSTPGQFDTYIKAEIPKWAEVVRRSDANGE